MNRLTEVINVTYMLKEQCPKCRYELKECLLPRDIAYSSFFCGKPPLTLRKLFTKTEIEGKRCYAFNIKEDLK